MSDKKTKRITLDRLATMVVEGFHDMGERMSSIEGRLGSVESRLTNVESRLDRLEVGQEDIKLRLDNVAHRFELVELTRRVDVLEKHVGISRSRK